MISYSEAEFEGMRVTKLVAQRFFTTNRTNYLRYGFEEEDLVSHLYGQILVPRYLKLARRQEDLWATLTPEQREELIKRENRLEGDSRKTRTIFYHSMANYKASLYTACWQACLAHSRRITAKKREAAFKEGAMVQVDQPDLNGDLPRYEGDLLLSTPESFDVCLRRIADQLFREGYDLAARIFLCVSIKGWKRKDVEELFPTVCRDTIEWVFDLIKRHLSFNVTATA